MSQIFFYVQHLLGIGHMQRAGLISEAAASIGLDVTLVLGGIPLPSFTPKGVRVHQLPALKAGPGGFKDLRNEEGRPIDEAWRKERCSQLLHFFTECQPEILLIEAFPFGRRQMSFELLPLLKTAHARDPRPLVVSSIRDILQVSKTPGRAQETIERLKTWFDKVLVHGDRQFVTLDESFPVTSEIENLIHYTGLVAAPKRELRVVDPAAKQEVIVSAGGGAASENIFRTALHVRTQCKLNEVPWRFITGPYMPESEYHALETMAGEGIIIERFRSDFRDLLAHTRLSISQCGYNTMADVLMAAVPTVVIPFSTGGETEQTMRAERLTQHGLATMIYEAELTPNKLVQAIDQAIANPAPTNRFDLDGALNTANYLKSLIKGTS